MMKIKLFTPHRGQKQIIEWLNDPQVEYITVCAGRRFGKTELAINELCKRALVYPNSHCLYMAFKGDGRQTTFSDFLKLFETAPFIKKIDRTNFVVTFTTESKILFRLAGQPAVEGIRGKKFDFMVLDEFALYSANVFEQIIQPTLATSDKRKVLFISTPRGRGQFYRFFQNGLDSSKKNWRSYRAPSSSNPLVDQKFLDDVKMTIPNAIYLQEYEAEFIDDLGNLFTNITSSILNYTPNPSTTNYAGIDLGFTNDYTCIVVINEKHEIIYHERFNKMTMDMAATKLTSILKQFGWPKTLIENNTYQGVYEMMLKAGCKNLTTFMTTSKSKPQIVENLINLFETHAIKIPNDDYYISEIESFEYQYNVKTRSITYGAPVGQHDDYVMATAIACWSKKSKKEFNIYF